VQKKGPMTIRIEKKEVVVSFEMKEKLFFCIENFSLSHPAWSHHSCQMPKHLFECIQFKTHPLRQQPGPAGFYCKTIASCRMKKKFRFACSQLVEFRDIVKTILGRQKKRSSLLIVALLCQHNCFVLLQVKRWSIKTNPSAIEKMSAKCKDSVHVFRQWMGSG